MFVQSAVRRAAPGGVDCYFDNVGGAISQVGATLGWAVKEVKVTKKNSTIKSSL